MSSHFVRGNNKKGFGGTEKVAQDNLGTGQHVNDTPLVDASGRRHEDLHQLLKQPQTLIKPLMLKERER